MPDASQIQAEHYDRIADAYVENLSYPYTEAYNESYFARSLTDLIVGHSHTLLEICCGSGEGCWLLRQHFTRAIGVDISMKMLRYAHQRLPAPRYTFVRADACQLPFPTQSIDAVVMVGGIHHVNDRTGLFSEISRVLRSGGCLYFREPVDDFLPWRLARALIYRVSPELDRETEHPLRRADTERQFQACGLELKTWQTIGFLGACILLNTDVLIVNRFLRYVPGIRQISRWLAHLDRVTLRMYGMRDAGLAVVGMASRP